MTLREDERRVLDAVRNDARLPIRDLAQRVGLPETTARDILHRLERNGVVRGYRALLDPTAVGASVRAWLVVRLPGEPEGLATQLAAEPGVERLVLLPERPGCAAMWVAAPSGHALALRLAQWSGLGIRIEESHPLWDLEEPGREDLRSDAADAWLHILKE